jgi:hypothetical protein
MSEEQ